MVTLLLKDKSHGGQVEGQIGVSPGIPRLGVERLVHLQRPLVIASRTTGVPLAVEHGGQVVHAGGQIGMALGIPLPGIQRLVHLQRPLEVTPRLRIVALRLKQTPQSVQGMGQVGMALP